MGQGGRPPPQFPWDTSGLAPTPPSQTHPQFEVLAHGEPGPQSGGVRIRTWGCKPGAPAPAGEWTGPWDRSCSWLFPASVPRSHWVRLLGAVTGGGHNQPGAPQEGTLLPSQPPSPLRASICSQGERQG